MLIRRQLLLCLRSPAMALLLVFLLVLNPFLALAQLVPGLYASSCPNLEQIVEQGVKKAVDKEARMAASLLRLHFHDCFVQGCDASVLLDDTPTLTGEKGAAPNKNSLRGFDVIDEIKAAVESACPAVVSCADILAIAARDSVALVGGPVWEVLLGRKDGLTASQAAANASIPSPAFAVTQLVKAFRAVGLTLQDMVALSGSHTIGKAHCFTFSQRLYNQSGTFKADPTMQSDFLLALRQLCPPNEPSINNSTLASLKFTDPTGFDNRYYSNLLQGEGLLNSDQVLYSTPGMSREFVRLFTKDQHAFFANFALSMLRMGNIISSSGQGEIRTNCRFVNQQSATSAAPPAQSSADTTLSSPPPPAQSSDDTIVSSPPPPPPPVSDLPPPLPPFPFF